MKFYFDEDSAQHRLVAALRSYSIDVITSHEAGMNAKDDESHLIRATASDRVLVSANIRDFAALHSLWLDQDRIHSGILIIPQQRFSTGEIVRRILRLSLSKFDMANGLYFLSNF